MKEKVDKINTFMETSPIWKIFLIYGTIVFGMAYLMFYGFISSLDVVTTKNLNFIFYASSVVGIVFGLLFTMVVKDLRNSAKFWKTAEDIKNRLLNTENKEELDNITAEIRALDNLANGSIHNTEMQELCTILKVKQKYVK